MLNNPGCYSGCYSSTRVAPRVESRRTVACHRPSNVGARNTLFNRPMAAGWHETLVSCEAYARGSYARCGRHLVTRDDVAGGRSGGNCVLRIKFRNKLSSSPQCRPEWGPHPTAKAAKVCTRVPGSTSPTAIPPPTALIANGFVQPTPHRPRSTAAAPTTPPRSSSSLSPRSALAGPVLRVRGRLLLLPQRDRPTLPLLLRRVRGVQERMNRARLPVRRGVRTVGRRRSSPAERAALAPGAHLQRRQLGHVDVGLLHVRLRLPRAVPSGRATTRRVRERSGGAVRSGRRCFDRPCEWRSEPMPLRGRLSSSASLRACLGACASPRTCAIR